MPAMPETVSLHIQARDSDPVRVVELTGGTVRVGRSVASDVRLADASVPADACRLRRRLGVWHVEPVALGSVRIDGRELDEPSPLAFGEGFDLGPYHLTLQPTGSLPSAWRRPAYPAS